MKLSVIIPVFNEDKFIAEILKRISSVRIPGVEKEIIVVDDFSADGTREQLRKLRYSSVKVFFHERNIGKGAAIKTGLKHAVGDIILFQDADFEYHPEDYPVLVKPIVDGTASVVYGTRFSGHSLRELGHGKLVLPLHFLGNKILTFLTNLLYGQRLSDMETGYKVFRSDVIKNLGFMSDRFDMEPEITAKLLKKKIRIVEVPIKYSPRGFEEGKKITWRDGMRAVWCLVRYRFAD